MEHICDRAWAELEASAAFGSSPHTSYARGIVNHVFAKDTEAVSNLQRSIAQRPSARSYYVLGLSLIALGRLDEATVALKKTICLDPDLLVAYFKIASVYRNRGQTDEARQVLEEHALERFRSTRYESHVHNEIGLGLEQLGDLEQALIHFRRAAETSDRSSIAPHTHLALTLYKLGRGEQARTVLGPLSSTTRLQIAPDRSPRVCFTLYLLLGNLALDDGDAARARMLLEQCLRYDPGSLPALNLLALAHEASGERQQAIKASKRALELDPSHALARRNLEYLLEAPTQEAVS